MINVPAAQQLRFAGKTPVKPRVEAIKSVQFPILKDHNRRLAKPPWTPSFSSAFRLIIFMRFFAGMYSIISDCDEVFNYWEPLHYLTRGVGFQTWEYSPTYSIRSYAYLILNSFPNLISSRVMPWDKRPSFFFLRLTFATFSSLCETTLYRSTVTHISPRVGRYLLFALLFSQAVYAASTAFLPSTFAMWGIMLSTSAALAPVDGGLLRITLATVPVAASAIIGWPFSALLGVPLVLEQLFVGGTEKVAPGETALWAARRARNMLFAGLIGASLLIPVVLIDSHAYQRLSIVPLNIINYNIFSPPGVGPDLYGTAPISYYINNLLLTFNILFPLALLSLPMLFITSIIDPKRFGDQRDRLPGQTSPFVSLAIRLSGMHLWFAVIFYQAHKEERFLFPAYGLIILNAATTLYLMRGCGEAIFIKWTKSPYRATQTPIFTNFTRTIMIVTSLLSLSRIAAVHYYYHAPLNVYGNLQAFELPRLAIATAPSSYPVTLHDPALQFSDRNFSMAVEKTGVEVSLLPLQGLNGGKGVRLCVGKEWYRFPGHYLVPNQVEVRWIRSEFKGILPKIWEESSEGKEGLWGRNTGGIPTGMNDRNLEEMDRYVDINTCDYLIDLDFPHRSTPTPPLEPRYAVDSVNWERIFCHHFLDNENSSRLTRTFLLPFSQWHQHNSFGDYCLLRSKTRLPRS